MRLKKTATKLAGHHPLPVEQPVACGRGKDSNRGHSSIAYPDTLHYIGLFLEEYIHPACDNGDVILLARGLFEG